MTAVRHGNELLLKGFTVDQVVHDYGDLCQAVTELAIELDTPITNKEFHSLNRCLDSVCSQTDAPRQPVFASAARKQQCS